MKFTIKTIGCKVNTYESNKIKDELISLGFIFIDVNDKKLYKELDYYIINTCSVTALADKKSRQMIHSAREKNNKMKIIATGCSISKTLKSEEKIEGIDIEVPNDRKNDIVKIILEDKNIDSKKTSEKFNDINDRFEKKDSDNKEINSSISIEERVRAFIKIEDGCDEYCTYCIIPYLRGTVKSRDDDDIIEDIKRHLQKGVKEIVLTGIHLSSFGLDRENLRYENKTAIPKARENLTTLINKIAKLKNDTNIERLRLGSLEPRIIDDDFIKKLSTKPILDIFCPSFCLSLQSGSNKILKLMNRHYTVEDFENAVKIIKKYFPSAFITTDIIVGFPGETVEDYEETVNFARKMKFYNPNIFPYSKREGTSAYNMENQLTNKVKHDRSVNLINICNQISKEIEKEYNKNEHEILAEERIYENGKTYDVGYTKEYVKIKKEVSTN